MLYISIAIQFPFIFHPFFLSASMFIQFHPLSSIIHPYFIHFLIHFHPFFMFHHRCSPFFALVMFSSIYNPVIFHFHPVASVHTALERSLFYRIPQRFPNGHSMFRPGTARLYIIFKNSFVYIYISIISIHFPSIIHCFPPSSLILFNPCSSILIKSFHACSIFPFPSSFHPFFILFSFLHQCLSNFIHCHPLFIHISSIF